MGERRRSPPRGLHTTSHSSPYPRHHRSSTYPPPERNTVYPPASAFFVTSSGDDNTEPQPIYPDTSSHFHYSTTFRMSPHELVKTTFQNLAHGDLRKALDSFTGRAGARHESRLPVHGDIQANGFSNGYALDFQSPKAATASAKFSQTSIEETVLHFRTSVSEGLPSSAIPSMRTVYGYNEFSVASPEPLYIKFAKTIYESPLILLLCGSALVSALMGNIDDSISITVAVLIVLTVGFVQERRSEKSLEALNKLVPHHCHLVRSGQRQHVLANELLPGDVVTFTTGDRVPADVRLITAVDLDVDESSLTGEAETRRKDVDTCSPGVNMSERSCIAHMGTLVRNGRGTGVVVATGAQTEFGVVFTMVQDVEEKKTPLQLSMDELAQKLSMMSFGVIGVICLLGVWQQRSWLEMFTIGVSLAVAAIPEGLPVVTTVTLALGVLRMSRRKAIVKKLHSVESLGSVSVICSDKTGTFTLNEQTVTEIYVVDELIHVEVTSSAGSTAKKSSQALKRTLDIGSICNNASMSKDKNGVYIGQSTDIALLNVLPAFGMVDQRQSFTRLSERPFNSENKYMAVSGIFSGSDREMYFLKGSIDGIIDKCKSYFVSDDSAPDLDSNIKNVIMTKARSTAARGLRIIAMAYGYGSVRDFDEGRWNSDGLVFAGFQAMYDPPRKGVADSIALLQSGGVHVVMITGDSEQTALSIAKQLGLRIGAEHEKVDINAASSYCLTGQDIDKLSKGQLMEKVGNVSVFARTTARHKMAIVEAFQSRGAIVAMTGDGVNDAPALKMADIGVSMGKSGTDVAKEAADVILVDDNFSTILPAIEEGKSIFHNIQNFLSFQLSTAAAALSLITLSTFFGLSNPLNAMQILFINILMDGPPSQSLGVDPVDHSVMRKPPRRKDAPIISKRLLYRVLFSACIIVVETLFVYMYALSDDRMSRREQTMTFTCFVFLDLVSALQNRGLGCRIRQNRMLLTTVSISFLAQLGLIYVPVLQAVFQTTALDFGDLMTLLTLAGISFGLHEGRRRYEWSLDATTSYSIMMQEMV